MARKNITKRVLAGAMALLLVAGNSSTALTVKADDVFVYTDSAYNYGVNANNQGYSSSSNFYLSSPTTGFNIYNNINSGDNYSYNNFILSNPNQSDNTYNNTQPEASFPTDPQFDVVPNQPAVNPTNQSQTDNSQLQLNNQQVNSPQLQMQTTNQPALASNGEIREIQPQLQAEIQSEIISGVMNASAQANLTGDAAFGPGSPSGVASDAMSSFRIGKVFTTGSLGTTGSVWSLDSVSATINVPAGTAVTYNVYIYAIAGTGYTIPDNGKLLYCYSSDRSSGTLTGGDYKVTVNISDAAHNNYLNENTQYGVVFTFAGNGIKYYRNTSGEPDFTYSEGSWDIADGAIAIEAPVTQVSDESVDHISIVAPSTVLRNASGIVVTQEDDIFYLTADIYKASAETAANKINRKVSWSSDNSGVITIDDTGRAQINGVGKATITVTAGSKNKEINIYSVGKPSIADSGYDYAGANTYPGADVKVNYNAGDGNVEIPLNGTTGDTNFTVTYTNSDKAGTATVTIAGKSATFSNYSKTYNYAINPKNISGFANPTAYTIDTANDTVTACTFTDDKSQTLVLNTDYEVSLTRGTTTATAITYNILITGKGNYTGSKSISSYSHAVTSLVNTIDKIGWIQDGWIYGEGEFEYTGVSIKIDDENDLNKLKFYDKFNNDITEYVKGSLATRNYTNNTNPGTATFEVYSTTPGFSKTVQFTIIERQINSTNTRFASSTPIASNKTLDEVKAELLSRIVVDGVDTGVSKEANLELTLPGNGNAIGSHNVTVTGKNFFEGTVYLTYEIKGNFNDDVVVYVTDGVTTVPVTAANPSTGFTFEYTGAPITTPRVTRVTIGGTKLASGDYNVTYLDNTALTTESDKAKIIVTGQNKYAGETLTAYFDIKGKTIPFVYLNLASGNKVYTGSTIELDTTELSVKDGATDLTLGADYDVAYANNLNAGQATVTVTGKGNYAGTFERKFTIAPANINNTDITYVSDSHEYQYTGAAQPSYVTKVELAGFEVDPSNYTVTDDGDYSVGSGHRITIIGKNNLTGTKIQSFEIKPADVDGLTYVVNGQSYTSSGSTINTSAEITYTGGTTLGAFKKMLKVKNASGKELTNGVDYIVSGTSAINVGTVTVTVRGLGNYASSTNTVSLTYTIKAKDISSAVVTMADNTHPENAEVKLNGTALTKDIDYTYAADPSIAPGNNKVATYTGKGNYSGSVTATYTLGTDIGKYELVPVKPETSIMFTRQSSGFYNIYYMGPKEPDFYLVDKTKITAIPVSGDNIGDIRAAGLTENVDYIKVTSSDYTITYSPATDHYTGNVKVEVTNKDTAKTFGTVSSSYGVMPVSMSGSEDFGVTINGVTSKTYDGIEVDLTTTPVKVVYYYAGKANPTKYVELTKGTDYEIGAPTVPVKNAGTYSFTVTGKGNYSGNVSVNYKIEPKSLADSMFSWTDEGLSTDEPPAINYTGSYIKPEFAMKDGAITMSAPTDYDLTWTRNKEVTTGTSYAELKLTGTGNYKDTITKQFQIKTVNVTAMSDIKFVSTDHYYTGSAIKPALGDFDVYIGEHRLIPGVDYKLPDEATAQYGENIKPSCVAGGGGRVTIEGIGTYLGTKDLNFPIYVNLNDSKIRFTYDDISATEKYAKGANVTNSEGLNVAPSLDMSSSKLHIYFDEAGLSEQIVGSDAYTVTTTDTTVPGWCTVSVAGKADKFTKEGFSFKVPLVASLDNATVTMTKSDYAFKGTGVESKPDSYKVTLAGKELTKGKDYQVDDSNDGTVGIKTLTVKACTDLTADNSFKDGAGVNHPFVKGSKSANYYIKYDLNAASVTFTPASPQTYDGKEYVFDSASDSQHALTPSVKVNGADVPSADLDFVSYPTVIKDAGKYQITIKPKTDSTTVMGTKVATFEITGIDISDAIIEYNHSGSYSADAPGDLYYTGSPVTPAFQVKKGSTVLTENEHYTVSWSNNIKAGTATVTVTGKGSYQGVCTSTFEIKKKNITSDVEIAKVDPYYAGGTAAAPKPELTLTYSGKTLKEGEDYTVEINVGAKNANASSTSAVTNITQNSPSTNIYSATIKGKNNFEGEVIAWYGIKRVDIASAMVVLDENSKTTTYTGNKIEPSDLVVTLTYNFPGSTEPYKLVKGTDYKIECNSDIQDMGEYTILIKGIGNFEGQYDQQKYTVTARNIAKMYEENKLSYVVNNNEPYPYTSSAVTPTAGDIVIYDLELPDKDDSTDASKHYRLEVNKDYKIVQYSNNTSATGEAIISIEGMGNYGGNLNLKFKIGKDIADALKGYKVNLSYTERTFDGTAKTPTVKLESIESPGTFISNAYFTVTYPDDLVNSNSRYDDPNHIETEAKVIKVTGRNGYFGTIEGTYKVLPVILNVQDNAEGVSTAYHPTAAGGATIGTPLNVRTALLGTPGHYYAYYEGLKVEPDVNSIKDPAVASGYTLKPYNESDASSVGPTDYYYDYKISYHNSEAAGPANITISFSGNYVGTLAIPYDIKARSIADETQGTLEVELDKTEYQFKNSPIMPNISKIYYRPYGSSSVLELSDYEYDVEYSDNIYPGIGHVYVTCNGYYSGVKDVEFTIYGYMEDANIHVDKQFYTGNPITKLADGTLTIFYGSPDHVLVEGVDYEITNISDASVPANSWNSAGKVNVTGRGFYRDTASAEFAIEFNASQIYLEFNNDYKYTGKPIRPNIILKTPDGSIVPYDRSKVTYNYYDPTTFLGESEVYTATSTDGPIKPGHVEATIPVEIGTETAIVYAQYTISKNNLADCIVSYSKKEEYTGLSIEPQVSVIDASTRTVISPDEYTLTYSNNVWPGTDTAVITITPKDGTKFDLVATPSKSYYFSIVSPKIRNLASTATSATSVRITWSGSPRISGYILYDSNGNELQQTSNNFFDVAGLTPATSYNYQVAPVISNGYVGEKQPITAVTQISQAIGTVDDTVPGTSKITWTGNSNVLGYQIWRATTPNDPNHGTFIASVPRTSTNYTDKGLVSGRTYYYYLRGYTFNSDTRKFEYGQFSVAMPVTVK